MSKIMFRGRETYFSLIRSDPCDAFLPQDIAAIVLIRYGLGKNVRGTTISSINHQLITNIPLCDVTIVFGKKVYAGKRWETIEIHCKKLVRAEAIYAQLALDFDFDPETE